MEIQGTKLGAVGAGVLLLLSLSGCNLLSALDVFSDEEPTPAPKTVRAAKGVEKSAAGAGRFRVGDHYTFDNPIVRWEIMSIRGERVYWRNDLGDRQVTGFNPLLPAYEWQSRERGSGRRVIRDLEGSLFPMRVGATMSFRATVTSDRPPFGWEHVWSCRTDSRKTLEILGGKFDTFVVNCGRERPDELTFYYAPKVGHFVIQYTATGGRDDARHLLSFERANGTVVAGIVADSAKKNIAVTMPPTKGAPAKKRTPRAVNPVAKAASDATAEGALESVMLRRPVFGGNAAPPAAETSSSPPPVAPPAAEASSSPPPAATPMPRAAPPPRAGRAVPPARLPDPAPPKPRRKPATAIATDAMPAVPKPVPGPRAARVIPPPPLPPRASPTVAGLDKVKGKPAPTSQKKKAETARSAVHLASYRSAAQARKGWDILARGNGDLLKGLKPEIRRVELKNKGVYYRLFARPAASSPAELCRKLRGRGVYCAPVG